MQYEITAKSKSEFARRVFYALFYRQKVVVIVHRAKKQRRIVLKRTAAVGF